MLEKRIEIRWRDVDAYGHVNNAVYLNYLEEARDAWVQAVLGAV
jgi:acyl-CoA thioester hydrolase